MGYLVVWLALMLSTLAPYPPVAVACKAPFSTAQPHACCASHPMQCACGSGQSALSPAKPHAEACRANACSCHLTPSQESAPQSRTSIRTGVLFPALLTTIPKVVPAAS